MATLSKWSAFTSPRISGLGNVRSDKAIMTGQAASRFGAVRTKES
jgi:preprotein translocase subunit SecD